MARINLDFYKGVDEYSDGEIEEVLLNLVKSRQNLKEIVCQTDNWAVLYHFLPVRENILDWYDFDSEASLLEIGAGCGALTGMFARKVKRVVAVELSKKRAEIIYYRYRRCRNIEILVGNINDMSIQEKFDYVTLIGVLEYAGKFTKSKKPFQKFLEKIKSYLKPKGRLFIAIENKFGIKYWAGAREDHVGRFFESIENYPNVKEIKTFGKLELEKIIKDSGFKDINFYYPMPDYKLPKVIYSDDYLPGIDDYFEVYSPNFDRERCVLFNESHALKGIIKNQQFPFFANSFLVEASL